MAYCTLADLRLRLPESRLVELTDDTHPNAEGEVQVAVVDRAIESAGDLIDSYLGQRFSLPLVQVPKIVRQIAEDLAICFLYDRATEMSPPEGMTARRAASEKLLEKIAAGELSLGLPEQTAEPVSLSAVVASGKALFSLDSMGSL